MTQTTSDQEMESSDKSMNCHSSASVNEFYAGKSVFITGGTGFIGKVFIEKLLYSCKDIQKIYILLRNKNGMKTDERLSQLINKPLFSRLKIERPQDLKKIVPIEGDVTQPDLGLSKTDEKLLIDNVSIVFHIAATVKFNEKLDVALNINVNGTKHILNLCHRINNIKLLAYVSTAYSYTGKKQIEEKIFPSQTELTKVLKYIEQPNYDEKALLTEFHHNLINGLGTLKTDYLTLDYLDIKDMPNTYTLTKSLAENLIVEQRGNIPVVVIKPSIVCPSLREPLRGWVDSWTGAVGLTVCTVKCLNLFLLGDKNNILDIIPVDYVSNTIIVAAAKNASLNDVAVYNSCTSSCNPLSIKDFANNCFRLGFKIGLSGYVYPMLIYLKNEWILYILTLLAQIIPAHIADLFLRATGRQPKYVKLQSKIITGRNLLNYYTNNSWEFKADNIRSLYASLSPSEKIEFPCDASDINWTDYLNDFMYGVKDYLLYRAG